MAPKFERLIRVPLRLRFRRLGSARSFDRPRSEMLVPLRSSVPSRCSWLIVGIRLSFNSGIRRVKERRLEAFASEAKAAPLGPCPIILSRSKAGSPAMLSIATPSISCTVRLEDDDDEGDIIPPIPQN